MYNLFLTLTKLLEHDNVYLVILKLFKIKSFILDEIVKYFDRFLDEIYGDVRCTKRKQRKLKISKFAFGLISTLAVLFY